MPENTIKLEIFRYHPDRDSEPRFQSFDVPYRKDWVVLDAINWIKDNVDGSLTYRWSCRMGVCGSCGMMINGTPKLSCAAFLKDYFPDPIRVEPLNNFPVEQAGRGKVGFGGRIPPVAGRVGQVQAVFDVHQLHALLRRVSGDGLGAGIPRAGGDRTGHAL
jgi:hypothetical protein